MNTDFELINPSAATGKSISAIFLVDKAWKTLTCKGKVPTNKFLRNYELNAEKRRFLILDNYGEEYLSESMLTHLFGDDKSFDLAVDLETTEIYRAYYNKHTDNKYSLSLVSFERNAYFPKKYLGQIDELKTKKRPWHISIWEQALYDFIEHGYDHLRKNLIIGFDFRPIGIQVFVRDRDSSFYREVSLGKSLDE